MEVVEYYLNQQKGVELDFRLAAHVSDWLPGCLQGSKRPRRLKDSFLTAPNPHSSPSTHLPCSNLKLLIL